MKISKCDPPLWATWHDKNRGKYVVVGEDGIWLNKPGTKRSCERWIRQHIAKK